MKESKKDKAKLKCEFKKFKKKNGLKQIVLAMNASATL